MLGFYTERKGLSGECVKYNLKENKLRVILMEKKNKKKEALLGR